MSMIRTVVKFSENYAAYGIVYAYTVILESIHSILQYNIVVDYILIFIFRVQLFY